MQTFAVHYFYFSDDMQTFAQISLFEADIYLMFHKTLETAKIGIVSFYKTTF
jgi:hypothetical protein